MAPNTHEVSCGPYQQLHACFSDCSPAATARYGSPSAAPFRYAGLLPEIEAGPTNRSKGSVNVTALPH
jgi:hypothetical protein